MTFRESDRSIVPLSPTGLLKKGQSGNEKPSNIGAGKAEGIFLRDPDQAPPVLSDGTLVITRLARSMIRTRRTSETISVPSDECTPPLRDCAVDSLPACMSRLPSEVWEPDALTAHVRIHEGPRVNEAKYQKIQAPTKYWMANRESTRYYKPKRPRSTPPEPGEAVLVMVNFYLPAR